MAAGENFSLFLTQTNQLYSCGANTFGQLGVGEQTEQKLVAGQQATIHAVKGQGRLFEQISTGSDHCFALTQEGELYSWGLNFKGQLGLGDYENRYEPYLIENLVPGGEASKNGQV